MSAQVLEVRKGNVPPVPANWAGVEVHLYDPLIDDEVKAFIREARNRATIVSMTDEVRIAMDKFTTDH